MAGEGDDGSVGCEVPKRCSRVVRAGEKVGEIKWGELGDMDRPRIREQRLSPVRPGVRRNIDQ